MSGSVTHSLSDNADTDTGPHSTKSESVANFIVVRIQQNISWDPWVVCRCWLLCSTYKEVC